MSDLISREALILKLTDRHGEHYKNWKAFKNYMGDRKVIHSTEMNECKKILDIIVSSPAVEAVPVVHGEWIKHEAFIGGYYECNLCGAYAGRVCNFCLDCGADMRTSAE